MLLGWFSWFFKAGLWCFILFGWVFKVVLLFFYGLRLILIFFQGSFMVLKIVSYLLPIIGPEVHIWQTLCRVMMGQLKTLRKRAKIRELRFRYDHQTN